jgi:hypothetical protein
LLRANVQQAQQVLRRLVKGRLTFTPRGDHYEFSGTGTFKPVLTGIVRNLASPTETDHEWIAKFEGFSPARAA